MRGEGGYLTLMLYFGPPKRTGERMYMKILNRVWKR